jgi:hypothetical protein
VPVAALLEGGVPRWRLYRGDTKRVFRGILVEGHADPALLETRIAGARALMRPGRFLSRATAALAYDIPLLREPRDLEVGAVRPMKPPERRGIRGHQVRAGALLETPLEPLWLPSPAEIWALLAGAYPLEQVIMAGDFLISGRDRWAEPLCSIEELTATARRFSGCSGSAKLVAALPRLRTGVESPAESLTRLLIENAGLPTPQTCCSVPVDGRVLYADLGYPE